MRIPEIGDKACLTDDHEVLTTDGWININNITLDHKVAILNRDSDKMEYVNPTEIFKFEHKGDMYEVESQGISLKTTLNHRMYVKKRNKINYELIEANDIMGKRINYKSFAPINNEEYNFVLEDILLKEKYMDAWIQICGIWYAEGWSYINEKQYIYRLEFAANKEKVRNKLKECCEILNWNYNLVESTLKFYINNKKMAYYMKQFSVGAINKKLPDWVFNLDSEQSKLFIKSMCLGDGYERNNSLSYFTSSINLRDDVQKLCQHAGWTSTFKMQYDAGHETKMKDGRIIKTNVKSWVIKIKRSKLEPTINHGHTKKQNGQKENIDTNFNGFVYCLKVSSEVFLVRRNGKICFTGNSSRHGQKGIIGMMFNQEDLPYSESGIVPDLIINPNSQTSRMTVAHLIECLYSKEGALNATIKDCTPFEEFKPENIYEELKKYGFEEYGNEKMYNGMNGEVMDAKIFIGPTYYQRFKHMVRDKYHVRSRGPMQPLVRQPSEGRSRSGGLRVGEMEKECILSHGASNFVREKTLTLSDMYKINVCDNCGMFVSINADKTTTACKICNSSKFSKIVIPYATKLLFQELTAMGIACRVFPKK